VWDKGGGGGRFRGKRRYAQKSRDKFAVEGLCPTLGVEK